MQQPQQCTQHATGSEIAEPGAVGASQGTAQQQNTTTTTPMPQLPRHKTASVIAEPGAAGASQRLSQMQATTKKTTSCSGPGHRSECSVNADWPPPKVYHFNQAPHPFQAMGAGLFQACKACYYLHKADPSHATRTGERAVGRDKKFAVKNTKRLNETKRRHNPAGPPCPW